MKSDTNNAPAPVLTDPVLSMGPKFGQKDDGPNWVTVTPAVFAAEVNADTRKFVLEIVQDELVDRGEKLRTRLSAHLHMDTGAGRRFTFKVPIGDLRRLAEWLPKQLSAVEVAAEPVVSVIMAERKLYAARERARERAYPAAYATPATPATTGKTAKKKAKKKAE
jgi:hypothetical protein